MGEVPTQFSHDTLAMRRRGTMDLSVLCPCYFVLFLLQLAAIFIVSVSGSAVQMSVHNYEEYVASREIIFLNFYADWCRFSQQLKPVFDKAAATLHAEFPNQVLLGKVDCDRERNFCTNPFHISKYPTLKLVRNGEISRREYRGQRAADSLVEFVRKQLSNPVEIIEQYYQLTEKDVKRAIVGYFPTNSGTEYVNFEKAARILRDDCPFYALIGQEHGPQIAIHKEGLQDISYTGDLNVFDQMMPWIHEQCIPLVREITFANGEELTEEGLPLLLLFYPPDDADVKDLFKQKVEAELLDQKGVINFVTADGVMFAHPLHHLGKSKHDLPLIAIDSFRHMYLFPNFEDIRVPGKLRQFVDDLHSGKLHKDFHSPPAPTTRAPPQTVQTDGQPVEEVREKRSDPPESTFKKLQPARSRYTLRDEL